MSIFGRSIQKNNYRLLPAANRYLNSNGLRFNGSNQYGIITGLSSGSFPNEFTILMWFRYTTTPQGAATLLGIRDAANAQNDFQIAHDFPAATGINANWVDPSNSVQGPTIITTQYDSKIHQIAITLDSSSIARNYFDGNFNSVSTSITYKIANYTSNCFCIGALNSALRHTPMILGEFRFFNFALTENQIKKNWNSGKGNNNLDSLSHEVWYKFNETSGTTTAIDSSGNGRNLTLNNYSTTGFTPFLG